MVDNGSPWCSIHDRSGDLGLKLGTKAAVYGIAGLVLASAVIFSGSTLGYLNPASGVLSVLLTDPPTIPAGVTAVYVSYSNLAVHATGFGEAGWVNVPGEGTIDTLKLINLSQTISSGSIPSLTYNLISLNITDVKVTFMGKNYTASVSSGKLVVPIVGGVKVSSSDPAAALVDIQPVVLNIGNETVPSFTIATGARALMVPRGEVNDSVKVVGNNMSLQGRSWFQSFRENHTEGIAISSLNLTADAFTLSALNKGSDPVSIRMVIITLTGADSPSASGMEMGSSSVANSIVFAVQSDGFLKLISGTPGQVGSFLGAEGYSLAGGASHQFTYSGAIASLMGKHGIVSGSSYSVVLMGAGPLGAQTVVAA